MNMFLIRQKGFTFVEVVVAVAIIGLLVSVGFASFTAVREKSRDTQRKADLEQIQLTLRLYKDANGTYPDCAAGMVIGENAGLPGGCNKSIDGALGDFFGTIPSDPMGSTAGYDYVYDSDLNCIPGNPTEKVLYANTTESGSLGNWTTVCNNGLGNQPGTDTYVIILQ